MHILIGPTLSAIGVLLAATSGNVLFTAAACVLFAGTIALAIATVRL